MRAILARRRLRRGAAAVELAVLLPVLTLLFVGIIDFGRVFYYYQIVTDCASDGALYASSSTANSTNTTAISSAALAGASNLSPQPTVTPSTVTVNNINYVKVNVTYTFNTISGYPGIPSPVTLTRTVQMMVAP
jgi:Flp pilus assembly protein TadG